MPELEILCTGRSEIKCKWTNTPILKYSLYIVYKRHFETIRIQKRQQ